jgi:hypothetical protein
MRRKDKKNVLIVVWSVVLFVLYAKQILEQFNEPGERRPNLKVHSTDCTMGRLGL